MQASQADKADPYQGIPGDLHVHIMARSGLLWDCRPSSAFEMTTVYRREDKMQARVLREEGSIGLARSATAASGLELVLSGAAMEWWAL
jgi:hypothetical protein